jgi:hypothetical protein
MVSTAFNTRVNAIGARLNPLFGSAIRHWDLPDVTTVLEEAYDAFKHGWLSGPGHRVREPSTLLIPTPTYPTSKARSWPMRWSR